MNEIASSTDLPPHFPTLSADMVSRLIAPTPASTAKNIRTSVKERAGGSLGYGRARDNSSAPYRASSSVAALTEPWKETTNGKMNRAVLLAIDKVASARGVLCQGLAARQLSILPNLSVGCARTFYFPLKGKFHLFDLQPRSTGVPTPTQRGIRVAAIAASLKSHPDFMDPFELEHIDTSIVDGEDRVAIVSRFSNIEMPSEEAFRAYMQNYADAWQLLWMHDREYVLRVLQREAQQARQDPRQGMLFRS